MFPDGCWELSYPTNFGIVIPEELGELGLHRFILKLGHYNYLKSISKKRLSGWFQAMEEIVNVTNLMVELLKEMGVEAKTSQQTYGLRGYASYLREIGSGKSFHSTRAEDPISYGLKGKLICHGLNTEHDFPYPGGRTRCDLIIWLESGEKFFVEFKTAYRERFRKNAEGKLDYDGTLLEKDNWEAGVLDIGNKDLPKLIKLNRSEASYIGILLAGFDRENKQLEPRKLFDLLPRELESWNKVHGSNTGIVWPDNNSVRAKKGFRDRVWLWYREVAE